jgi:hypothetical protein
MLVRMEGDDRVAAASVVPENGNGNGDGPENPELPLQ